MHLKKGHGQGPRSILKPLPEFGTGEARNFKFGIRIEPGKYHLRNDKIHQKGRGQSLWAIFKFLNFKPPSVNLEWVKLEMSNLVYR